MQLPETVRVAGITYNVHQNKDEVLEARGLGGECDYMRTTITLRSNYPDQMRAQVFIHEMVHAMLYRTGLENKEIYNDEDLIRPLANVLFQVLRDNDFNWLKIIGQQIAEPVTGETEKLCDKEKEGV
jgi:hypothetical protein